MNNQNIDQSNSISDEEDNEKDLQKEFEMAEKKKQSAKQPNEYSSKDESTESKIDSKNKLTPKPIKANQIRNSIMVHTSKQDKQEKQDKKQVMTANMGRRDSFGVNINRSTGKKKHHIQFKPGSELEVVFEVQSYKKYNTPYEESSCCCVIF